VHLHARDRNFGKNFGRKISRTIEEPSGGNVGFHQSIDSSVFLLQETDSVWRDEFLYQTNPTVSSENDGNQ